MSINAGDHDCTTGLSGAIKSRLLADGESGIPGSISGVPLGALRALIYSIARETADAHNADSGGGGPPAPGVAISGLTTSALASGLVAYMSNTNTAAKAQSNGTLAQARVVGAYAGTAGAITVAGAVTLALTTAGGAPSTGDPIYLASSADDGATGAGKGTATAPSTGYLVEIAITLDASGYAGAKTVVAAWQPKAPFRLS